MAKSSVYYQHIDSLRAISVILVIVYHAFPDLLLGGALGVDVFFVISGFVVTSAILPNLEKWDWHQVIEFFSRRVRRIIPSLCVMIIVTAALFCLIVGMNEKGIFKAGGYAALGIANVYLYFDGLDYFSTDTQLNPFLHTWSLGVEEQFYVVLAFLLLVIKRQVWIMALLVAVSLFMYVIIFYIDHPLAFYAFPMRFWELGTGVLLALYQGCLVNTRVMPSEKIAGASWFLLCIPLFFRTDLTPLTTVMVAIGAGGMIIYGEHGWVGHILKVGFLRRVGLRSYSLYLWHWPCLVLGRWTIGTGALATVTCIVLAIIFAEMSYRYVETPLRKGKWFQNAILTVVAGGCISVATYSFAGVQAYLFAKKNSVDLLEYLGAPPFEPVLAPACHGAMAISKLRDPIAACLTAERTKDKPNVLFDIGDSHAAQMTYMLTEALAKTPYQLKFINTADQADPPYCLFGEHPCSESVVYRALLDRIQAGDVVFLSFFKGHLNANPYTHIPLGSEVLPNDEERNLVERLNAFADELAQRKADLVLVLDVPMLNLGGVSVKSCAIQARLFGASNCGVDIAQDEHTRTRQGRAYRTVAKKHRNVSVWDAGEAVFAGQTVVNALDNAGKYRFVDSHHITARQAGVLTNDFTAHIRELDLHHGSPAQ